MQHVLKIQLISLLAKYIKLISRDVLSRSATQVFKAHIPPVHQQIHEWKMKYRTSYTHQTLDLYLLDLTYVRLLCKVSNADTRLNSPASLARNHAACGFSNEKLQG
jgi:hypothetical protein